MVNGVCVCATSFWSFQKSLFLAEISSDDFHSDVGFVIACVSVLFCFAFSSSLYFSSRFLWCFAIAHQMRHLIRSTVLNVFPQCIYIWIFILPILFYSSLRFTLLLLFCFLFLCWNSFIYKIMKCNVFNGKLFHDVTIKTGKWHYKNKFLMIISLDFDMCISKISYMGIKWRPFSKSANIFHRCDAHSKIFCHATAAQQQTY